MKITVWMGSPKPAGNTGQLLECCLEYWREHGNECKVEMLYNMDIKPCVGCKVCQDRHNEFGCIHTDDMQALAMRAMECDLLLLATPIYAWYCTAPMKAALDRAIYAGCKNYGAQKGEKLWKGISVAALTTCGYPLEKGADVWESGLARICRHIGANYLGAHTERDMGTLPFMDEGKAMRARTFAARLLELAGERC